MGDLSEDQKTVYTRQMEVYATLVESADHEVGRLVDAIDELGELDNTLIFYIAGDNGGSSIGDINGVFVEWGPLNGAPEDIPYLLSRLDEYGGPKSYPNYSVGWACAGSTPATWCIQMAHAGGNMAGTVVHWPNGIESKGEIRHQYSSVIDIVPTILEAVGIPEPKVVNGHEQTPMAGVSMAYTFDDDNAPERHTTQYNEVSGNRSIYHDGWLAAVVHRARGSPHRAWSASSTTAGSSITWQTTSVSPTTSLSSTPTSSRSSRPSSTKRRSGTASTHSTTGRSNASTPSPPAART